MPKVKAVHFRDVPPAQPMRVAEQYVACGRDISRVSYSFDPDDTTCNNCRRSMSHIEALSVREAKRATAP